MEEALSRVLRNLAVGSKRFLTNKVDRSVTGLIARQQCCGPLQLTVGDVAVIAQSHFGLTGAATSIGEQPIKMLVNPKAGARMAVGEALTNIVWARISRPGRYQVFGQLDVGAQTSRRRRGPLRCGWRDAGSHDPFGDCGGWRKRQSFHGDPGRRRNREISP